MLWSVAFCPFLAAAVLTEPSRLLFMGSPKLIKEGIYDQFWQVNLTTNTLQNLPLKGQTFLPGRSYPFNAGATVCDNKYFGVWNDINAANCGLASVELQPDKDGAHIYTGKAVSDEFPAEGTLYHAIFCDVHHNPPRLLVVRSDPGDEEAQFSVRQVSLDGPSTLVNDTFLANFTRPAMYWGGTDAIFGFRQTADKAVEAWASFPSPKRFEKSGNLQIIKIQGGGVTTVSFPSNSGYPFSLLTDDGAGKAHVATHHGDSPEDCCSPKTKLVWNEMVFSQSGELTLNPTSDANATDSLWDHDQPIPLCDGLLWSHPRSNEGFVYGSEPLKLKVEKHFDIGPALTMYPGYWVGGLTCA